MSFLPGPGVPVLMYHWINPDLGDRLRLYGVTPRSFARQVRLLRRAGYAAVGLRRLLAHLAGEQRLPTRSFVLTFDDGYRDNVERAAPILEEAGWTATVFMVTDRAGGVNEWDLRHGDAPRPLLSWDEIRRLDGGTFSFEPHSRTHPELTRVDAPRAREEIEGSKKKMEDELGRRVSVFSYPHGVFNVSIEAIVRGAGYEAAVTDIQGLNRLGTDPMRIRRTMITSRDFAAPYAFKILTGYGLLGLAREAARRGLGRPAAWEEPRIAPDARGR